MDSPVVYVNCDCYDDVSENGGTSKNINVSPSQHSFIDMVTILEESGSYDLSRYPHTLHTQAGLSKFDTSENTETDEKNGIGTATVSLEMSPTRTSNSAALIEEALAKALESAVEGGLPPILPMIVLPEDGSYWMEGDDYESARDSSGKWTAQDISTEHIAVVSDTTPYQFNRHFKDKMHENYIAHNKNDNPVLISICHDNKGPYEPVYRIIIRTESKTWHNEYTAKSFAQEPSVWDLISLEHEGSNDDELLLDDIQLVLEPKAPELLQKFDEHTICTRYKFGILYQKYGQKMESELFGNESHSPAMEEFLNLLGSRVKLKGFKHYKAGLDTSSDMTGKESVYTHFQEKEIMFHVSTLLPYEPLDKQQIERKRHIGNDVVTIIFQDTNTPFCPSCIRSHFLHVFIVVQVEQPNTPEVVYKVAVTARNTIGTIEPALPVPAVFRKGQDFRDFLLTKLINAEVVARGTSKFKELNEDHKFLLVCRNDKMRTRQQLLVQLIREFSPNPDKRRRGRNKSDVLSDQRVKTKRKPSLNLGSLLLGKVKDASSEYLLSPRSLRKKATEIVHLGPGVVERDRHASSEDVSSDKAARRLYKTDGYEAPIRSLSVQANKENSDIGNGGKGHVPMRNRAHSQGEKDQSVPSVDDTAGDIKRKSRKSLITRVKNLSTKRKLRHSVPTENAVTLVGIPPSEEQDNMIYSMEDVRVSSSTEQIWNNRESMLSGQLPEANDGNSVPRSTKDPSIPLSQSVPSSPITVQRSFSYGSAVLRSFMSDQRYVYTPKEQSPNSKAETTSKPGAFSPLAQSSASSLRKPHSISADSFGDLEEKNKKVRSIAVQTSTMVEPSIQSVVNHDTIGILLRKIEELNDEVTRVRKENVELLKKQGYMYAVNQHLAMAKTELERKLLDVKLQLYESDDAHPMANSSTC